jgi:hypothetical protein
MLSTRDVETAPDEIKLSQHSEIRVLIVHDNPLISAGLAATLSNSQDFTVTVDCPGSAGNKRYQQVSRQCMTCVGNFLGKSQTQTALRV